MREMKIGATIKSSSKKLESVVVIDIITLSTSETFYAIIIDGKNKMRAVYLDDLSNCHFKE